MSYLSDYTKENLIILSNDKFAIIVMKYFPKKSEVALLKSEVTFRRINVILRNSFIDETSQIMFLRGWERFIRLGSIHSQFAQNGACD